MKLLDVMTAPWAIVPAKLREIRAVYETHMRGDKLDLKGLQSAHKESGIRLRFGGRDADEDCGYVTDRGVAIIPVMDVLTKARSFYSYLFGSTSMRDIGDAFRAALADRDVRAILLHVDSPGGTVDGTEELANLIRAARGTKPIVAFADGLMASAAYWIGAAADRIYIGGETTEMGSIGVVATHIDVSKQDEMYGEKWTEVTAGKYKRLASAHRPLTEEGKNYIQEQVDEIYRVFVESVAEFRGLSVEQVLTAADGRIFMGREAVAIGLADEMAGMDDIIEKLKEEPAMNLEEFKAKHFDLHRQVFEEGRAAGASESAERARKEGYDQGKADGVTAGAETERARIQDVEAQTLTGYEELAAGMKYDGKSTGADVAMAIVQAEKKVRAAELQRLQADAIQPAPHATAPDSGDDAGKNLPLDVRAKAEWDKSPQLREEFGGDDNFNAYLAYLKNVEAGRVKILGRK